MPIGIAFVMIAAINARCLYIFYNPTCPHCQDEMNFLYNISQKYNLTIHQFNVLNPNVTPLFLNLSAYYNSSGDVPLTFVGNEAFVGFTYGNISESVNPRLDMGFSGAILRAIDAAGNSCPNPIPISAFSCNASSTRCATVVSPGKAQSLLKDNEYANYAQYVALVLAVIAAIALARRMKRVHK